MLLIVLTVVIGSTIAGWRTLSSTAATHGSLPGPPKPHASALNGNLENSAPPRISASSPVCAKPVPDKIDKCNELERQVLASTVRLEWRFKIKNDDGQYTFVDGSMGLATIKTGRYLVTHNHPSVPLSGLKKGELTTVSVFTANGRPLWIEGSLEAITITEEDPETLILDFGSYGGEGLFGSMGMVSAEFKAWESLSLQPGMEVAQINWDGETTDVDWVTIEKVITEDNLPKLELANSVAPGTSGGGVFWNGYHIANTRSQVTAYGQNSGAVLREYSVAALNSAQVAGQLE
ncbi:MAG: hypothetical protein GY938_02940 [Ketobacter sp.]|nr:hypothetical protein [Ketobacter sp.]